MIKKVWYTPKMNYVAFKFETIDAATEFRLAMERQGLSVNNFNGLAKPYNKTVYINDVALGGK